MMKGAKPDSSNPSLTHLPSTPAAYTTGNRVNSIQRASKGLAGRRKVYRTNEGTAFAMQKRDDVLTKGSMKQINPD